MKNSRTRKVRIKMVKRRRRMMTRRCSRRGE
jgi:hypothetical protein